MRLIRFCGSQRVGEEKEYKVMGRQSHFKIQIFRGAVPHDKRSKVCFCKWGW